MTDTPSRVAQVTARLRTGMADGVLSFPLTAFTDAGELAVDAFRQHLRRQLAAAPGALFPCCGTGEFFSLAEDEYQQLVQVAVEETAGRVPVVAGIGYGWPQAVRFARLAEAAGADAALLMPPYLVSGPQQGLVQHVREVASRTELPLVVYQRAQVRLTPASLREIASLPTVVGVKDGHSDLDQLQRLRLAAPSDLLFFNGALTAEMQVRAYSSIGVPAYSSSTHAFAPEIARAFFAAHRAGDDDRVEELLGAFYWPLVELRDKGVGYAVSLVKAAARLRGEQVGPVRAPLADPPEEHVAELEALLRKGLALVGGDLDAPPGPAGPADHRGGDR